MLRAGLVRQTSAGIYAWLPLGLRVLRNIERIVREEQDQAGAQEILMPTIQPAELWKESGRYDDYGKEMLRITDRHGRDMLYGPTNEEMVTDLFRQSVRSYRELPQILYHIQWKFRDEVRPRFGVMRGREFLMKDAYSFDLDHAGAVVSYRKMMLAYMRTFQRMGLKAIPMEADTGPIGGDLSHEFIILAPTGESQVYFDAAFEEIDYLASNAGGFSHDKPGRPRAVLRGDDHPLRRNRRKARHRALGQRRADRRREGRGIEVGHIFYFGTKYTKAMGATVAGPDGKQVHPGDGQLRHRRLPPRRRRHRGQPRRRRHHLAGQHRPVQGRHPQPENRRRRLRRALRTALRRAGGNALYDDRDRPGRRQIRRRRPDGPSLADHCRPARRRRRQSGTETPRHRRTHASHAQEALTRIG